MQRLLTGSIISDEIKENLIQRFLEFFQSAKKKQYEVYFKDTRSAGINSLNLLQTHI